MRELCSSPAATGPVLADESYCAHNGDVTATIWVDVIQVIDVEPSAGLRGISHVVSNFLSYLQLILPTERYSLRMLSGLKWAVDGEFGQRISG